MLTCPTEYTKTLLQWAREGIRFLYTVEAKGLGTMAFIFVIESDSSNMARALSCVFQIPKSRTQQQHLSSKQHLQRPSSTNLVCFTVPTTEMFGLIRGTKNKDAKKGIEKKYATKSQTTTICERGDGSSKVSESYEQMKKIGQGGEGTVWIVKRKRDKKVMVRKEQRSYRMYMDTPMEKIIFEKFLADNPPPSIIEFDHCNYIHANRTLVLYFEHCQGGDLHDYLPGAGDKAPERFLWQCFTQLAEAIAFLHWGYNRRAKNPDEPPRTWCRIIHRDIKPENVFLRYKLTSKYPDPELVLADFGLATVNAETYDCGTWEWQGPETPLLTKEGDVWSVGAIIHALAHGRGPVPDPPRDWPSGKDNERRWYKDPRNRWPKQLSTAYSSALNRNMMRCLKQNPRKRCDAVELAESLRMEGHNGRY